ncbi:MAG TPA: ABC transporter permease, partial [Pyrinomonadaceae bacterium]|nr:ABC transporter permease [Pyrinomonadaceae bacterium]
VLLRPLPYRDPDQIAMLWESNAKRDWRYSPTSFPNFVEVRQSNNVFSDLGAFIDSNFNLTGGDEPERVTGFRVSPGLLSLLGVEPAKGRLFLQEEGEPGARHVVILSHGLWQRRFGGAPDIIGREVSLNGYVHTVVGVMPADFTLPPSFTANIASSQYTFQRADLWVPLTTDAVPMVREVRGLIMMGRLKPGVTPEQAQAEMNVIASRLEQEYPTPNAGLGFNLVPAYRQVVGDVRQALFILLGAVGFVLLIACANVANLLLAKAAGRQKEIAIRTALGASRRRIVQQLLTESAILGLLGGAVGLLLSYVSILWLRSFSAAKIPRLNEINIDGRVLVFTLIVSLLTALIFGLAPALYGSKLDLTEALKEGGRSGTGGERRNRFRNLLVVSEVALALVLSIAAGLMMRSFLRLQNVNPGFNPENVATLEIELPENNYNGKEQQAALHQQLLLRIASIPGAQATATVDNLPFSGNENNTTFTIEGKPIPPAAERSRAFLRTISPDYFRAMGIPLSRGRFFTEDDRADTQAVAIINEEAARRYFPGEDALGKRIKRGRPESQNPFAVIVGIIGSTSHTALDRSAQPELYLPYLQNISPSFVLVARSATSGGAFTTAFRREVAATDPKLPVSNLRMMEELIADSVAQQRLYTLLLATFACVALTLASVGIYGVLSYSVSQRTQEIGVRMALGAQAGDIYRMILGQSLFLIAIGLTIGLILSLILTRLLSSLLYEVSASDPLIFIVVTLLLIGVALLASYLPARRAANVHPLVALRQG